MATLGALEIGAWYAGKDVAKSGLEYLSENVAKQIIAFLGSWYEACTSWDTMEINVFGDEVAWDALSNGDPPELIPISRGLIISVRGSRRNSRTHGRLQHPLPLAPRLRLDNGPLLPRGVVRVGGFWVGLPSAIHVLAPGF